MNFAGKLALIASEAMRRASEYVFPLRWFATAYFVRPAWRVDQIGDTGGPLHDAGLPDQRGETAAHLSTGRGGCKPSTAAPIHTTAG